MKKKLILALVLSLCIPFAVTGCGGDEIKIESRTDTSVTEREGIVYSPDESPLEESTEEAPVEDSSSEESSGSMFRFGTTSEDAPVEDTEPVSGDEVSEENEENEESVESEDGVEDDSADTEE